MASGHVGVLFCFFVVVVFVFFVVVVFLFFFVCMCVCLSVYRVWRKGIVHESLFCRKYLWWVRLHSFIMSHCSP